VLIDKRMKEKLKKTSSVMRAQHGPSKAAKVIDGLTRRRMT
jgi:UDP:flavonoid glycosyltransferase YjiC (YdhE family)